MINPIRMISSMQELMDKRGFRYPFAITYEEDGPEDHLTIHTQPIWTKYCRHPFMFIAYGDNDNHAKPTSTLPPSWR